MKIIEAIERVDALVPNQYTLKEKIDWYNELGAELVEKYVPTYKTVILKDGELLPPGVTSEHIDSVILGGTVLKRQDIDYSSLTVYPESVRSKIILPNGAGELRVTYRVPYEPIRYIREPVRVKVESGVVTISELIDIRPGDIITVADDTVNVSEVLVCENMTEEEKNVERVITELTAVPAPHDTIYVEFLIAKIARFQKDYEMENRALTNFNTILSELAAYMIRNGRGVSRDFFNYW